MTAASSNHSSQASVSHQRQVVNWLRCNNDASLRHVIAVMALAGAEVVFDKVEGRK